MNTYTEDASNLIKDPRFEIALQLFNTEDWYSAHDAFEELWHETNGPERQTLQGFLQIAVAQVHLSSGNSKGATILYGEGLGRLRMRGTPTLGLDIDKLCCCVEARLKSLHLKIDPNNCDLPSLSKSITKS